MNLTGSVLMLEEEGLEIGKLVREGNGQFGALQIGREAVGELRIGARGARHDVGEFGGMRGGEHESLRRLGMFLHS